MVATDGTEFGLELGHVRVGVRGRVHGRLLGIGIGGCVPASVRLPGGLGRAFVDAPIAGEQTIQKARVQRAEGAHAGMVDEDVVVADDPAAEPGHEAAAQVIVVELAELVALRQPADRLQVGSAVTAAYKAATRSRTAGRGATAPVGRGRVDLAVGRVALLVGTVIRASLAMWLVTGPTIPVARERARAWTNARRPPAGAARRR